ncbi:MAG: ParB/RepB/Spo0J family partition protein [Bacteroidota bacterium]
MAKKSKTDLLASSIGSQLKARKSRVNFIPTANLNETVANSINEIPLKDIVPNPQNPRQEFNQDRLQELADSIKSHGLIQPITVKELPNKKYEIIAGERRFRASKLAQMEKIPAYIRPLGDQNSLELAVIENIQRVDLSPFEAALSYQRLMDQFNWTQTQLADRLKKGRITITHTLGVLSLPPTIIAALQKKETTLGHVKGLLSFKDKVDYQLTLFKHIQENKLSVREAEQYIKQFKESVKKGQKVKHKHQDYIDESVQELKEFFGAKSVALSVNNKFKGKLVIPIDSQKDFEFILEQIKNRG